MPGIAVGYVRPRHALYAPEVGCHDRRAMAELASVDTLLAVCLGIGLAAASGFRIFLPPLALAVAAKIGVPGAAAAPEWLASWPAIAALGTASTVELVAYYVPWLDNALDTIASPAAIAGGILLMAGVLDDLGPVAQWSIAIVGGGAAAGVTQTGTVVTRALSTAITGGIANFVVSTLEAIAAVALAVLAIVFAPLALIAFVALCFWLVRVLQKRRARRELGAA